MANQALLSLLSFFSIPVVCGVVSLLRVTRLIVPIDLGLIIFIVSGTQQRSVSNAVNSLVLLQARSDFIPVAVLPTDSFFHHRIPFPLAGSDPAFAPHLNHDFLNSLLHGILKSFLCPLDGLVVIIIMDTQLLHHGILRQRNLIIIH